MLILGLQGLKQAPHMMSKKKHKINKIYQLHKSTRRDCFSSPRYQPLLWPGNDPAQTEAAAKDEAIVGGMSGEGESWTVSTGMRRNVYIRLQKIPPPTQATNSIKTNLSTFNKIITVPKYLALSTELTK